MPSASLNAFQNKKNNKSILNVTFGLIYQVVNTGLGLLLPYFFITGLGSETNGLLNSVGQLFVCLGLLEAGVGTAALQALYMPVSKNNHTDINQILSAANQYYLKTGIYYSCSIVIICAIYPIFVTSTLSNTIIREVILLQGCSSVIGYFAQAKFFVLFQAEGKNYLQSILLLIESIIRNAGKIIAIKMGYGVISIQIIHLSVIIAEALFVLLFIKVKYAWIDLKITPNFGAVSQKKSVLVQSAAWMVFNHTDILVLTVVSKNLSLVSVYSVYLLVFEAIQNIMSTIRNSFQYKIGQMYCASAEKMQAFYCEYAMAISAITGAFFFTTYVLSSQFVELYTANVRDINYLMRFLPELFVIYKVLYNYRGMVRQAVEATGYFNETKKIAIIEAGINILVSVLLAWKIDIYGVLLGSIVSLIYSVLAYSRFVGCHIFNDKMLFLLGQLLIELFPIVLAMAFKSYISITVSSFIMLVLYAVPAFLLIALLYFIIWTIEKNTLKRVE